MNRRKPPAWRVQDHGDGLVEAIYLGVRAIQVDSVEDGLDHIRSTMYRGDVEIIEADGYVRTERV